MAENPTQLIQQIAAGDRSRIDDLSKMLYSDFRRIAASFLKDTKHTTLQPTAVVHEAYLKLVNQEDVDWQGRTHFLAVGARAMRQILVDHARKRSAQKRGAGRVQISLQQELVVSNQDEFDVLAIHEALNKLQEIDEERARIVELRFYGGLTIEEVAEVLGSSRRTIQKKWAGTKAWLRRELTEGD